MKPVVSLWINLFLVLCIVFLSVFFGYRWGFDDRLESQGLRVGSLGMSYSMYPGLMPGDELENRVFEGDRLLCGHVYLYRGRDFDNSSVLVAHRFIYEGDGGELFFKGDNNFYPDDPIGLDDVVYEVVGVTYK